MILLAFLLPFSLYLTILGSINRRRRPVMVSGVTDFIGILFAASGFLLFGGPAILSSLNERWRMFWLLGHTEGVRAEGFFQFWIFLSLLYFLVVITGAALVFRTQRHLTSVYNADAGLIERCLVLVCEQMGLDPAKSGNLFVFGVEPAGALGPEHEEGLRAAPAARRADPASALAHQAAVLEVVPFARMRHVTLRWDPANSALRREVEGELMKVLREVVVEPTELGIWLTIFGVMLFGLTVIAGVTLAAIRTFATL